MKKLKLLAVALLMLTACNKNDDGGTEINTAPEAFNLIAVTNNAIEVDLLPTFSWNSATDPDGDAVSYNLYVDTNENPTTLYAENITTTNFELTERLNVDQTYYWKVEATDENNATTLSNNTYSFTTRGLNYNVGAITTAADFSERTYHTSVVFDHKLWVIGGYDIDGLNDVWYSADGISWTEATANAPFSERFRFTTTVFDDKLWVIGGSNSVDLNDVWYSADGITWTEATANAPFSARSSHTTVVFDNKLWVIGGYDNSKKNDVWYSADGISWTEATANAPFSGRYGHTSVVFDNKLWVIGGDGDVDFNKNDVWCSADGINWTQVTANASFSARYGHASAVFGNKLWIIGGIISDDSIWYSKDGTNWTEATANAPFSGRYGHTSVVFDNKLWVIGGYGGLSSYFNDVWAFE